MSGNTWQRGWAAVCSYTTLCTKTQLVHRRILLGSFLSLTSLAPPYKVQQWHWARRKFKRSHSGPSPILPAPAIAVPWVRSSASARESLETLLSQPQLPCIRFLWPGWKYFQRMGNALGSSAGRCWGCLHAWVAHQFSEITWRKAVSFCPFVIFFPQFSTSCIYHRPERPAEGR